MLGPACAACIPCKVEAIPCCVVAWPTPVCPAAVTPCCSKALNGATCISGNRSGCWIRSLDISINSNFLSSIPGASLTKEVVVEGAPPPPPPPPKYCFNPVSGLTVPDPPNILNILDSKLLICASSVSPLIPFPDISLYKYLNNSTFS